MLKAGDQIVVVAPLSTFYGMHGEIVLIDPPGSLFMYHCLIGGYKSQNGDPIPFMKHEISLIHPEKETTDDHI